MGAKLDPEYEKARNGFLRDLDQFHESRGLKWKATPHINGKEVDLYLLYQIVTSHGGWEKINVRNEWDDLLEHFNLPRAVNGGLSLKIIYLKYLELYEKIHYLGEDVDGVGGGGGGGRHEEEDDYDDVRHRRRYTTLLSKTPNSHSSTITPNSTTANLPVHVNPPVPFTDMSRAQLGMSTRLLKGADYDRLILSLQSPLPNDQDLAISICTLLSHETKHVLKFPKAPRILDLLLAHAGVYNHCQLRDLMQESYQEGRGLNHNEFWMDTVSDMESRQLLCECFVHKINNSIGIHEECSEYFDPEREDDPDLSEEERWILTNRKRISSWESEESNLNNNGGGAITLLDCCTECPCKGVKSDNPSNPFPAISLQQEMLYLVRKSASSDDKIGLRITQIANILRNLSFEDDNAKIMANNPTLLRFMLIAADCSWGTIPQLSLDLLGNLAQHVQLKEPSIDPISCRLLSLVTNGLFATDRFRILRSLESLRELCKNEGNEDIFKQYIRTTVFKRLCELLTISDIMLLIYTLECLLSMTGLGEAICNELARVHGSVATLVSLVTVEAQSYGPKGCILMRVVETVTGTPQSNPAVTQPGGAAVSNFVQSPSSSPQPSQPIIQRQNNVNSESSTGIVNSNIPGMIFKPSITPNNVYTQLSTQSRNSIGGGISSSTTTNHIVTNTPTVTTTMPIALPVRSNTPTPTLITTTTTTNQQVIYQQQLMTTTAPLTLSTPSTSNTGASESVVSNQNLNQQVYIPSLSVPLVTSKGTLSEEGWAIAWLKGAFEVASGTSIEQGESYRMYCAARKNPQAVLSSEQFLQCVKCAYGTAVGPVIKHFGGSSLSFIEGIRPKISIQPAATSLVSISVVSSSSPSPNTITASSSYPPFVRSVTATTTIPTPMPTTTTTPSGPTPDLASANIPVSVHSPSRENKNSLSPILKATLSRPPKTKNLGVTQRQQKKLQLALQPKNPGITGNKSGKVNGIDGNIETEESSASSSMNSSEESDAAGNSRHHPPTSFQGILRNGLGSDESSKDEEKMSDELLEGKNKLKSMKGMLIDLLERKVNPRESMNGLMSNREIRISDKGLELVDKHEDNSNSSVGPTSISTTTTTTTTTVLNANLNLNCNLTNSVLEPSSDSQSQMTFYSTTEQQVTFLGKNIPANKPPPQRPNSNNLSESGDSSSSLIPSSSTSKNVNETVLMSGGGSCIVGNGTGISVHGDGHSSGSVDSSSSLSPPPPPRSAITTTVAPNASISIDGTDLLEKFNQISDLIVVPPEQLGIKRSHSLAPDTHAGEDTAASTMESEPPSKKPNITVNGNGCSPTTISVSVDGNISSSPCTVVSSSPSTFVNRLCSTTTPSVLEAALGSVSLSTATTTTTSLLSTTSQLPSSSSIAPNFPSAVRLPCENKQLVTAIPVQGQPQPLSTSINNSNNSVTPTINASNTTAPNQMMQLRLSVNPQNQLTFARQLVLPSGQQLFLSTSKSQSPLQGQFIISKPHNASNDQMAKAIIILQQPQHQSQPTASVQQNQQPVVQTTTPLQQQLQQQHGPPTNSSVNKLTRSTDPVQTNELNGPVPIEHPYLCEWTGCGQRFNSPTQVFSHASKVHTPEALTEAVRCEWGPSGCDPLLRKRLSLMTHLQDRHCSKHALELSFYRRRNKIEAPGPPPQNPVHHPGYAPNAAFHAIKRHAMQFMSSKELMDDNEGPVTKSIRLSSALILKNIANYSTLGRRMLKGYESQLASIALSNVESSRTIAQLLYDMQEVNS